MARWLRRQGHSVGRKRVRRLMRKMGLSAIYQAPMTSTANADHKVYPYLLRNIPMRQGFFLPRGDHGLAQQEGAVVAIAEHARHFVLRRGITRSFCEL